MLYQMLDLTRDLSDGAFEATIDQLRTARRAAREAVAIERKTHEATRGISTRRALEAQTSGDMRLVQAYVSAGLSPKRAAELASELDP